MTFSKVMRKALIDNPALRKELFALKKATVVKEGLEPTARAKRIVADLNRNERRVLDSQEARTAFDQVVKPECRPYQPIEDCFNKGYMNEGAFLTDIHNERAFDIIDDNERWYGGNDNSFSYYLKHGMKNFIERHPSVKEFVNQWRAIRVAQGETAGIVSNEGLRIKVPKPKKAKVKTEAVKTEPAKTEAVKNKAQECTKELFDKILVKRPNDKLINAKDLSKIDKTFLEEASKK